MYLYWDMHQLQQLYQLILTRCPVLMFLQLLPLMLPHPHAFFIPLFIWRQAGGAVAVLLAAGLFVTSVRLFDSRSRGFVGPFFGIYFDLSILIFLF